MTEDAPTFTENKGYRTLGIVIFLCVVGLMGWLAYYNLHMRPATAENTLREQFVWRFADAPSLPQMARRTTVTLRIAGVDLPAGTYEGDCSLVDGQEYPFLPGELSGVVCQSGSAGTEIGIFRENDGLVLKRSPIAEADGRGTDFVPVTKDQI